MTTVAAFDVDGTLTTRDCVVPFLELLVGRARLAAGIIGRPMATTAALVARDRDRFKAIAVRAAYADRDVESVSALGASFAERVHANFLRVDTPKRLEWHRLQGHRVVLVSASLGSYLHPLGAMLGVDAVLCTEVVVDEGGRYTGELVGANCRGPEKMRRLGAWLTQMSIENVDLWAYGDSKGDRELLAAAHHSFLVKDSQVSEVPEGSS
ncbi:MAG: HAD-IB family hydrolase [Actinomycetota bacterium]|jgi:phosphatidylglycerophosphatase C